MAKVNFNNTTTIRHIVNFLRDECKAESLQPLQTILRHDDKAIITLIGELWLCNDSEKTIEILRDTVGLAHTWNNHHWTGAQLFRLIELSEKYNGTNLLNRE